MIEPSSLVRSRAGAAAALALGASVAAAQTTARASVGAGGTQAGGRSWEQALSPDGRYVVFRSSAADLVAGDVNGVDDVFLRDRQAGSTELVSVDSSGAQGDATSLNAAVSADGRYVVFESAASNLDPLHAPGQWEVYLRDRTAGTTTLVSVGSGGQPEDGSSWIPRISEDGRYVAFGSVSTNLVPGGTNGLEHGYVRDLATGTTELVTKSSSGVLADAAARYVRISGDGRFVAWCSAATNLVPGDTNGAEDVFVRELATGAVERVSVGSGGAQANGRSDASDVSADGRFVTFWSFASNLVQPDSNGCVDVFLHDRTTGATDCLTLDWGGSPAGDQELGSPPSVSADGRWVAFDSTASTLLPVDHNAFARDVFVRDRTTGAVECASVNSGGFVSQGDSLWTSISADGRYVAFRSEGASLVSQDTNDAFDVFVRDQSGGDLGAPLVAGCDPGTGGVAACPCGNPPSGPGRGCDNASGTGGATLSATGFASLSSDAVVLRTSGERPTALSIVVQGNASAPSGIVYGQGIRCAGGGLKRLYTKSASGGAITAPDATVNDDWPIAFTSALRGDPIAAGQSRWYFVYYRDPNVLGGCPASSTFNTTPTGRLDWGL